ncbi:hypothetical protein [Streptomyces sp. NPDC047000]|uniref:hypothetical protein n=1 Tax=Streptomyces sp. NPDC047000 TaxID=3155474 RepID=UPI0033D1EFD4
MTDKHDADLKRVGDQNDATDFVRGVEDGPRNGLFDGIIRAAVGVTPVGRAVATRTDFGKRDLSLNAMIDLVEGTDPEDLESSGKALWDARDAIKTAAEELDGHIQKVHWVGDSGDAFRTWGGTLVVSTHHLSDFAGAAGDQITAAAVGLAAVRSAMPARDTQANRKRPDMFSAAEKTADKEGYAAAVKVEKDRQEAINQMNRLGSYYSVSEEMLAALPAKDQTPTFTSMPDVGVPQPSTWSGNNSPVSGTVSHATTGHVSPVAHHTTVTSKVPQHVTPVSDSPTPTTHIPAEVPQPRTETPVGRHVDTPVGTHIDTTGTLPPATTVSGPSHTPPAMGSTPSSGVQTPVSEGSFGTPVPNAPVGRAVGGAGGFRGTPATGAPSTGRAAGQGPLNQMGRTASTERPTARGAASGPRSSPMGRGITGGTPRAGGTAAPRANGGPATGAGRSNGVVGGRPTAAGGSSAKNGSRIPRGTVIGGEAEAESRPATGRLGRRGVFGEPASTERPGTRATGSRAAAGTPEDITAKATARTSAARAERNGMTRGGAGLARDAGGRNRRSGREKDAHEEETPLPDEPRRDEPPVAG